MPRLKALNRYWVQHPPLHLLVAAYLDYKAPADARPRRRTTLDQVEDATPSGAHTPWMTGMGSIPAPDDLRNAATPLEGLAAAERLFFGDLMEI